MMELSAKINKNEESLTVFVKRSILDVWQDSGFAFAARNNLRKKLNLRCASEYASELAFEVKDVWFLNQYKYQS